MNRPPAPAQWPGTTLAPSSWRCMEASGPGPRTLRASSGPGTATTGLRWREPPDDRPTPDRPARVPGGTHPAHGLPGCNSRWGDRSPAALAERHRLSCVRTDADPEGRSAPNPDDNLWG